MGFLINLANKLINKKPNRTDERFGDFFIVIAAIGLCLFISGTILAQIFLAPEEANTEINEIQEQIATIQSSINDLKLSETKDEISEIEKELIEKQEMLKKATEAGIAGSVEIPDWIIQGLSGPTETIPIEQMTIDQLKAEIERIKKEIFAKQELFEKIARAGFTRIEEIPDWFLQGSTVAPQTTTSKIASASLPKTQTITPVCSPSCSTHGKCTATNICTCTDSYTGPTCSTAPAVVYTPPVTVNPAVVKNITLVSGKQTYSITTSHHSPNFTQAVIDPLVVAIGDTQTMSVSINDTYEIISVEARVETDAGIHTYPLSLTSGTTLNGTWQGSWVVHDTHMTTYRTTFYAIDSNNESGEVTLTWSDPCTIPTSGNWTPATTCTIAGVTGADVGNIDFTGSSITMTAGATLVFNSGQSITWGGTSISKSSGSQVKKTNLWMTDADSDGYPSSTTQIAQDSAPANGRRRNLLTNYIAYSDGTGSKVDYNDASASVYPGTGCGGSNDCGTNSDAGTCTAVSAGDNGLAACLTCNGSATSHVNYTDNTQDTSGNTCSSACVKCSSGSCVNQSAAEDLFDHCSVNNQCHVVSNVATNQTCNYWCGYQTTTQGFYNYTGVCNGSGGCTAATCVCGSIGTDVNVGTNYYYAFNGGGGGDTYCGISAGTCATNIVNQGTTCFSTGHGGVVNTWWTYCKCQ